MKGTAAQLVGRRYGAVLVIERYAVTRENGCQWLCRCDCGNEIIKETRQLNRSKHMACRACDAARKSQQFTTHGAKRNGKTELLYKIWEGMRARCGQPSHYAYHLYGAKGVKVCDEWKDYATFRAWAEASGYSHERDGDAANRPSIDRIDPAGDYEPDNCRWISYRENALRGLANSPSHKRHAEHVH